MRQRTALKTHLLAKNVRHIFPWWIKQNVLYRYSLVSILFYSANDFKKYIMTLEQCNYFPHRFKDPFTCRCFLLSLPLKWSSALSTMTLAELHLCIKRAVSNLLHLQRELIWLIIKSWCYLTEYLNSCKADTHRIVSIVLRQSTEPRSIVCIGCS